MRVVLSYNEVFESQQLLSEVQVQKTNQTNTSKYEFTLFNEKDSRYEKKHV
jgi:hypothetical protein